MRKIYYSMYSVFLLILSVVIIIICFRIFSKIPTGPVKSGSSNLPVLFIPLSLLLEIYIKIQILFKSDFSYRRTLIFLGAYNAINLFLVIICCGSETSASLKICIMSLMLSMIIPDLILAIILLKDRAKEKKRELLKSEFLPRLEM